MLSSHCHYPRKNCHTKRKDYIKKINVKILVEKREMEGKNLLWSLHMRTAYLLWFLKILKNTAVYSFKSFEAKTSSPNGPRAPLTDAPFWIQSDFGLVQLGSSTSAFSNSVI